MHRSRIIWFVAGLVALAGPQALFQSLREPGPSIVWSRIIAWAVPIPISGAIEGVAKPAHPVQVEAVDARGEDVPIILSGIGTVQALNTVSVRSRVDGEITAVLFREGQNVKAGEPLALVDARLIQAQVDQQEASRLKDQALLDGASLDLQRYENLVTKSFASQQQVDQQRALVAQYRAQVKVDEAQIAFARTQLSYTTIISPISGRTGVRLVDAGNYVRAGESHTIVVVSQVQPISVIFTLPATAVAQSRLTLGETKIPVEVYAADSRAKLDCGTVDLVDNQVDQSTGTIKLKATFPNADLRLWPGSFVEGRLTVNTRHDAVTVPQSAIRHGPRGDFVYLVEPDDTAKIRNVSSGQVSDGRVLVEKGLKPGDLVVTEGQFRLDNGTPVEVAKPKGAGSPGSDLRPAEARKPRRRDAS